MMCWRGVRQSKQSIEFSQPDSERQVAVQAFEKQEYRKHPFNIRKSPQSPQYLHGHQQTNKKTRSVVRPTSTKRTSSSSTGYTNETRSTVANSTESAAHAKARHTRQADVRYNHDITTPVVRQPHRAPMTASHNAASPKLAPGSTDPKKNMYVHIKQDNDTVTALSNPYSNSDGEYDDDISNQSDAFNDKPYYDNPYGISSEDLSDIQAIASYQPDGVLEATILRTDSDSTKDMSILGDEAHVSVYNLSERMGYDLRETGRNLSTFAAKLARACMVQPKLITKY